MEKTLTLEWKKRSRLSGKTTHDRVECNIYMMHQFNLVQQLRTSYFETIVVNKEVRTLSTCFSSQVKMYYLLCYIRLTLIFGDIINRLGRSWLIFVQFQFLLFFISVGYGDYLFYSRVELNQPCLVRHLVMSV